MCGGGGLTHTRTHTSLIFSLHSLYCFFCVSRKVVSSFFCWATICCWNFFSSANTVFIWGEHQWPYSCHFYIFRETPEVPKNQLLLGDWFGWPVKSPNSSLWKHQCLQYLSFTRDCYLLKQCFPAGHTICPCLVLRTGYKRKRERSLNTLWIVVVCCR